MNDTVIRIENVSKKYHIGHLQQRHDTLREAVTDSIKNLNRKSTPDSNNKDIIWALKDISLNVERGEVLGIIGRNGAGKSTLLKILSQITEPTGGRVAIKGRVGSLLEVGTGFHPELTGRENIYLNGAILGMHRKEIDQKFDEIVDFAEIEKFLDTPVKRYSSGMYVRLAFAVAAHLEPEILLVDEVLAVGDYTFQKKCLDKMRTVTKQGRTIVFVSHNMEAISNICTKGILLDMGHVEIEDDVNRVIDRYLEKVRSNGSSLCFSMSNAPGNDKVKLVSVKILDDDGIVHQSFRGDENIVISFQYEVFCNLPISRYGIRVNSARGSILFASTDNDNQISEGNLYRNPGIYENQCIIPGQLLNNGQYSVSFTGDIPMKEILFQTDPLISFEVEAVGGIDSKYSDNRPGYFRPRLEWSFRKLDVR